jgi:type VI secretion system protein ImpC
MTSSDATPAARRNVLRLLVLADLAPGRDSAPLRVEGLAGVDAALAKLAPELAPLRFSRLADFHPDALARVLAPPATAGDPLDALLAQVDLPAGVPAAGVAAAVGDERLRALEAAWRGVALLAARTGPAVQLEILPASREDFLGVFWDRVFDDEHEGSAEIPLSAVVLGYEFDRGPADVDVLRNLGRLGDSLRVPFLGAVGPAFWGIRQPKLLATLPDLVRRLEGSEYAKWNGLRRDEVALWLCLAANRPTVREAWGPNDRPLHAPGGFALGAVLAQSFAAAGVRLPLTGPQPPARLDDLAPGEPVDVLLPDQKALELSRVGLAPLVARKGEPGAFFAGVPMLQTRKHYDREEASRSAAAVATLSYQVFAGGAAHALQGLGRDLGPGQPAEAVQQRAEAEMTAFLATAGAPPASSEVPEVQVPEVQVEIQSPAEAPDVWEVMARLRPAFPISGAEVDLVLGSLVPR